MSPLDTQLIAAIVALFTIIVGGGRWMFNRMAADLDTCRKKVEAQEKAAVEELAARRLREQEELKAWRAGSNPTTSASAGKAPG